MDDLRFGGIARLYGVEGLQRLADAHVAIVGIGGVGSWAAEALARSGVGEISLFDLDDICVTNTNRQAHTLTDTVGQAKVEVMAQRIQAINPACCSAQQHGSALTVTPSSAGSAQYGSATCKW